MSTLLEACDLEVFYGDFKALDGISVHVGEGEIVAIIGANGAGKSTFLKTVTGLCQAARGALRFDGIALARMPAHARVGAGIAMVPEGRRLFPSLSVEENILLGAYSKRPGAWTLGRVFDLFPVLGERRHAPGTALSGGQQQMAAIARALMSNPRLLLCDELSLGLAPIVIADIYDAIARIAADGTSVVLVEQDVVMARESSERLYCFQEGRVALTGASRDISDARISAAYFGLAGAA